MPPKQRINRDMILEGAFSVFCREGMQNINARSVARELSCSTQPIFSYYSGMSELKHELEDQAYIRFQEMVGPAMQAEDPLKDACTRYLRFAAEEPMLFQHMFIQTTRAAESMSSRSRIPGNLDNLVAEKYGISKEASLNLCLTLAAYTHGMAAVLATGVFPMDCDYAIGKMEGVLARERAALS